MQREFDKFVVRFDKFVVRFDRRGLLRSEDRGTSPRPPDMAGDSTPPTPPESEFSVPAQEICEGQFGLSNSR
ncbi:MAG: hypothetical protein B0A82_20565 [Alkalinema sp. CACIAM 70d]|nr:MAG: hypothetical protein B0A82_20565 [Alkalinema sp. CACIAM 70d]